MREAGWIPRARDDVGYRGELRNLRIVDSPGARRCRFDLRSVDNPHRLC